MKIPKQTLSEKEQQWLTQNISERQYFLHNSLGSHHWRWYTTSEGRYLEIDDDKIATMFLLKFGQEVYENSLSQ